MMAALLHRLAIAVLAAMLGWAAAPLAAEEHSEAAATAPMQAPAADWAFAASDLEADGSFVFGQLDNGLRYILRRNATPQGTALVRMRIGSGSLAEEDRERGLAHFLEHMAFNGSAGVPEGEMVKLLEREGLAFGADTNAATGFDAVTYMLNLPRNDEGLLDTALMLMRETASELTLSADAVERERGVILAERRDRSGYAQRALEANIAFLAPDARYGARLPIGQAEVIAGASAADLRSLYERTYVPANTAIIIVGDYPADVMEAMIRARFADWRGPAAPPPAAAGPIDTARAGEAAIHLDPALSENITLTQMAPWRELPDTIAMREAATLRQIGYGIVNRRLARLARGADAPFRSAAFGTRDLFEDARLTSLVINTEDGGWQQGMLAAVRAVNAAMTYGFTQAEVAEQVANLQSAYENAAKASDTRSHGSFVSAALQLLGDDIVPTTPTYQLALFERIAPQITAPAVWQALRDDAALLADPLIRFQGRSAPEGGEAALRSAYDAAMALAVSPPDDAALAEFAYQDFGPPGTIVADTAEPQLGLRLIRFANGVRLTLKPTTLREDRISIALAIDGGDLLNSADNPLATAMVSALAAGGLGQHSRDELSSVLAGRSLSFGLTSGADAFSFAATTTRRDLALQLQLVTALVTDPGLRSEGEEQFRRGIDNFFASRDATPARALGAALGGILSDDDPRFTLQDKAAYDALGFAQLMADIGGRLEKGAIEIALVGDFAEDDAIAAVAATLGALPPREAEFLAHTAARQRSFTARRGARIITHKGEADQALVQWVWPTTDDSDQGAMLRLNLLARAAQIRLTETLREQLGQTYSPSANAANSRIYPGYGTFTLSSTAAADQVGAVEEAIGALIADLAARPVDDDVLERAARPLLEAYDNALKDLGGWINLAARAQSDPQRLARWQAAPALIKAITPQDLMATARTYLGQEDAVRLRVLPQAD